MICVLFKKNGVWSARHVHVKWKQQQIILNLKYLLLLNIICWYTKKGQSCNMSFNNQIFSMDTLKNIWQYLYCIPYTQKYIIPDFKNFINDMASPFIRQQLYEAIQLSRYYLVTCKVLSLLASISKIKYTLFFFINFRRR